MDLRLTKIFRVRAARLQGMFEIYNLFNSNDVIAANENFGSMWQRPSSVMLGRLFKFSAKVGF